MKDEREKITLREKNPDTSRLNEIVSVVCDFYDIDKYLIYTKARKREIVIKRQICHYFAKIYTKFSLGLIGQEIGGKNHATVLHSDKIIKNDLSNYVNFRKEIAQLKDILDMHFCKKDKTIYFDGYSVTYHYSKGFLL